MWKQLSDFMDRIYRICGFLSGLLLILLCCLVLYSILTRIFGWYSGGATDVAGYVMATSTFMALSYTYRSGGHIRVQLLVQHASGAKRRALEFFCLGFLSCVTSYLAIYMTRLALDSYEYGDRSQGADAILMWIPQTPVAIGAILFAVSAIHTLLLAIFDYDAINPETSTHEGPSEI
jgi:TRAP-type C4-dicarboxylate transport system permease small subunit